MIRIPFEKTVIEKVLVPDELLRECKQPNLNNLETNGDLEQALGEAVISIDTCNEDKADIRIWQEEE